MFNFDFAVLNTGHAMKMEDFEKDFNDFVKLGNSTQNKINNRHICHNANDRTNHK